MLFRRLTVLMAAASFAFPSIALGETELIAGDGAAATKRLTIYAGDSGGLQAKRGAPGDAVEGMFYGDDFGPAGNYWHLRILGDPAPDQTFGPGDGGVVPISNGPVTGDWTAASPARVTTVMHVQVEGVSVFEVRQTVRYTGLDLRFRVTWEVRNIDPENRTIPFVFGTSGDLYIDATDAGRGVFIDGPSRFVGGTNDRGRTTGGIQEVTSSRLPEENEATAIPRWASYEEGLASDVINRLSGADAFIDAIEPSDIDSGAGVSFADRAGAGAGLAAGQTARYEVVWHLSRPTPLSATPANAAKVLPASHAVTLSFVDADFDPVPGAIVRYGRTGVNATAALGSIATDAQGLAQIAWAGTTPGLDTLQAFVDLDDDGTQDAREPAVSAAVRWLADNHVAGPPSITPPAAARVLVQSDPANPEAPTYQFGRAQTEAAGFDDCTFDQRAGRELNLAVAATLQPGAGTIADARLFVLDRARHDPTDEGTPLPAAALADDTPADNANVHGFTVPCVVDGELWLEFTLTGVTAQTFRVPIGGLQLLDPQGLVYHGGRYDQAIAGGATPQAARAAAAIAGASVRLQRQTSGGFADVASGDPRIVPNVNPQTTGASGMFGWDVAPGSYRVRVTAPTCQEAIGGPVELALEMHVRMECIGGVVDPGGGGTPPGGGGSVPGGGGTVPGGGGTTPGGPTPPGGGTLPGAGTPPDDEPPDATAPLLRGLRLTAPAFRVSARSTVVAAAAGLPPSGSRITFALSERARVVFTIARRTIGRRVGATCRTQTPVNRRAAPCALFVKIGTLRRSNLPAGRNTIAFSGRIGSRPLAVGRYRLQAEPVDVARNKGRRQFATFAIVRR
jgi:hypothetical protein